MTRTPTAALSLLALVALPLALHAQTHSSPTDPPADAHTASAPAADRSGTLIEAIHRSGAVPRCWNAFLHEDPNAPSVHFRLRVEVTADGSVRSVALMDPTPEPFALCVRTQLRHVRLPAGDAMTVESGYAFSPGSTAPVPTVQ